ncbi:hypothetical protein MAR_021895 [Mya arenaria]|uniref:Uncharacterized protein n=1 Tax=Mya arenaria TaxID=6604 RepID=A0ABY7ECU3_MYAAR|nr:hypothetical protein MAR_021895 [Mya arenaria]
MFYCCLMNQHSSQQQDDADSPGCIAALTYEDLSKTTDASDYDALKAGDNGSGTNSSSRKAAQTFEELSTKTDTSVYTPLDESNSRSHNYYGNVKKGTSAFTISGNGTGTNGETVLQSANLKLTCTSTRDDIRLVEWFNKTRGDSNYKTRPSVLMLMNSDGTCEFDTTYTVPANMKCDCVNISMYTCTLISVQEHMKGDMWRCRFTHRTQNSSKFVWTNNVTIDLGDGHA